MTKQPTKEDIVELEEKSKLFLIMTCNYPEAPLSFEQAEKIYKALIQAGVIVDTKSSTINDELPGKPDENKTTGIPGAEPKRFGFVKSATQLLKRNKVLMNIKMPIMLSVLRSQFYISHNKTSTPSKPNTPKRYVELRSCKMR